MALPNPPPTNSLRTRTLPTGMPSAPATVRAAPWTHWDLSQSVSRSALPAGDGRRQLDGVVVLPADGEVEIHLVGRRPEGALRVSAAVVGVRRSRHGGGRGAVEVGHDLLPVVRRFDERRSMRRRLQRVGEDEGDRLAVEHQLGHRVGERQAAEVGQHAHHAGVGAGRVHVDGGHRASGRRAVDDDAVQQPREPVLGRVGGGAGHFQPGVDAGERLPHNGVGHHCPPIVISCRRTVRSMSAILNSFSDSAVAPSAA